MSLDVESTRQQIIDGIANFGAEEMINALRDGCFIAAAVHEELKDWSRMAELTHYAKQLDELPLKRG
ncbi:MAG TPA: hypothetical protein VF681_04830 [Abditibacteriaceae bacterium]|jgi:hypothetical protein